MNYQDNVEVHAARPSSTKPKNRYNYALAKFTCHWGFIWLNYYFETIVISSRRYKNLTSQLFTINIFVALQYNKITIFLSTQIHLRDKKVLGVIDCFGIFALDRQLFNMYTPVNVITKVGTTINEHKWSKTFSKGPQIASKQPQTSIKRLQSTTNY